MIPPKIQMAAMPRYCAVTKPCASLAAGQPVSCCSVAVIQPAAAAEISGELLKIVDPMMIPTIIDVVSNSVKLRWGCEASDEAWPWFGVSAGGTFMRVTIAGIRGGN